MQRTARPTKELRNLQAAGCSRRPVGDAFNERYAQRASHSEAAVDFSDTAATCNYRRQDCLRHVNVALVELSQCFLVFILNVSFFAQLL